MVVVSAGLGVDVCELVLDLQHVEVCPPKEGPLDGAKDNIGGEAMLVNLCKVATCIK